jgi:hypothetical protein
MATADIGTECVAPGPASSHARQRRLFDSHCHVIDHRFPIAIFEEG